MVLHDFGRISRHNGEALTRRCRYLQRYFDAQVNMRGNIQNIEVIVEQYSYLAKRVMHVHMNNQTCIYRHCGRYSCESMPL